MRRLLLVWMLWAPLAAADPLVVKYVEATSWKSPLPMPIRLRAERVRLTSSGNKEDAGLHGHLRGSDATDEISIFRCSDGTTYLVDDLAMALWIWHENSWQSVISEVHVDKTFGGMPPALPVCYLGNGRFAVVETVPGEVKEKSADLHLPQALAVTFLVDAKEGKILTRSDAFKYSQNPPMKIPPAWKKRFGLIEPVFAKDGAKQ